MSRNTAINEPHRHSPQKVYIIVINWNSWPHTIECLESIYRSIHKNFQIIVVDNGSTDQSLERIVQWANNNLCVWKSAENSLTDYFHPPIAKEIPVVCLSASSLEVGYRHDLVAEAYRRLPVDTYHPLILIDAEENLGFGSGNNLALRFIKSRDDADYVWLLNNDTVITPETLAMMLDTAQNYPGLVGSTIMHYHKPNMVQAFGGGNINRITGRIRTADNNLPARIDFITGASLMLDQASLERIGLFDENIFMYFEDIEFCLRATSLRIPLILSEAKVYHKGGASSSSSYFQWKNVYTNKIYVLYKYFGFGFWMFFSIVMWLANILNPFTGPGKKRASQESFKPLLQTIFKEIKQ